MLSSFSFLSSAFENPPWPHHLSSLDVTLTSLGNSFGHLPGELLSDHLSYMSLPDLSSSHEREQTSGVDTHWAHSCEQDPDEGMQPWLWGLPLYTAMVGLSLGIAGAPRCLHCVGNNTGICSLVGA